MESFYCIFCAEEVTSRQEALLCDGCDRWQHLRCQTGITRKDYRAAVRSGKEIVWTCIYCADDDSITIAESTRLDDFDIPSSFDITSQRSTLEYDSQESLEDNRKFPVFSCTWFFVNHNHPARLQTTTLLLQ